MDSWTWPLGADMATPIENVFDPAWTANPANASHYTLFRYFMQSAGAFHNMKIHVAPEDETTAVAYWMSRSPKFHEVFSQYSSQEYKMRVFVDYALGFIKNTYMD